MRKMKRHSFFRNLRKWFRQWRSDADKSMGKFKKVKEETRVSVDGFINEVVAKKRSSSGA